MFMRRRHKQALRVPRQLGTGKRWIRGAHTGLTDPHGLWIDTPHDEIYVANCGHLPQRAPQMPSITVHDRLADGDIPPKRTIQGGRTHLGMPIKVFVAVYPKRHVEGDNTQMSRSIDNLQVWEHPTDPRRDEVFVPKPLGSAILVFNRTDDGNAGALA